MVIVKGGLWIRDPFYESALIKALSMTGITFDFTSFDQGFDETCSFFLVDEEFKSREELAGLSNVFYLSDRPGSCEENIIYRYEDGWTIAGKIGENLGIGCRNLNGTGARMIGVYSGEGGIGTTSLAIGLAVQLSRQLGCKPLYLSLCPYNFRGFGREIFSQNKGDFVRFLYYMSKDRNLPIQSFTLDRNEFYAVNTGGFNPDWGQLDLKVMKRLEKLSEEFGYIICDFGNNVGPNTQELIDFMDGAVFVHSTESSISGINVTEPVDVTVGGADEEGQGEGIYLPWVEDFDINSLNLDYGNEILNIIRRLGDSDE